jgi:hypothetical protein
MNKKVLLAGISGMIISTGIFGLSLMYSDTDHKAHAEENQDNHPKQVLNTNNEKAKMQGLMLNSIDYFSTAKGTFEYFSESGGYHLNVDYQTDLSDNPKSYEKSEPITSTAIQKKSQENAEIEVQLYDGEHIIQESTDRNETSEDGQSEVQSIKVGKMSKGERDELKESKISERIVETEGEKSYIHRPDPSYMGVSKTSLFPEDFAMGFLEDNNNWDIKGQENIAGVDTVVIEGKLNNDYASRYAADRFKLYVEQNTGILIQMEVSDSAGKVKEFLKTKHIEIDKKLDAKLFRNTVESTDV